MNIFVLDNNPRTAAQMMCDKHVVKMILESCQLMSTAHHVLDGNEITRTTKNGRKFKTWEVNKPGFTFLRCTMINHPCTIWTRASTESYYWLWEHTHEMLKVYQARYNKIHCYDNMIQYSLAHCPKNIPNATMPPFAQAMPDQYKNSDAVRAYRDYYIYEKSRFAKWKTGNVPSWYTEGVSNINTVQT
jgi:hypothetical protein